MSNLIVVTYPDEHRAAEVLTTLQRLHGENLLDLADACYVTKNKHGHLKLHQGHTLTAEGAKQGAMWGGLVSVLLLVPFMFIPGVNVAAIATAAAATGLASGAGALVGHFTDYGIDDKFVKELSDRLQNGTSAIFVLLKAAKIDDVLPEVAKYGGTILHTTLSEEAQVRLQTALSAGSGTTPA